MQSQSSFSQISLQWVCGRQRGRVGMTEAQAGSWCRLRYGLLCLGLLQVVTWNLIVKGKHVCSLVSSEWPASARQLGLSYSLWLFRGCGGARAASRRWARQQEQQGCWFALSVPSLLSSCDVFRCLVPLCRDAAQGFVPPNYLLFNFCFLLKVLPVPGKMSS